MCFCLLFSLFLSFLLVVTLFRIIIYIQVLSFSIYSKNTFTNYVFVLVGRLDSGGKHQIVNELHQTDIHI